MTAAPPVLSPSSIILLPSSHCVIFPQGKIQRAFSKMFLFFIFYSFKNSMILKLPDLKVKGWECPYCLRLFTIFRSVYQQFLHYKLEAVIWFDEK